LPRIITHADHPKYQETEAFHEAGYDSLLTATIMIRLAAKLGAERGEQVPPPLPKRSHNNAKGTVPPHLQDFVKDGREKVNQPVPLPPVELPQPKATKKQKAKTKKKEAKQRRFETKNLFDTLKALSPELESCSNGDDEETELHQDSKPAKWDQQFQDAAGPWENDVHVQDKTGWVPLEQVKRQPMELIPAFDSKFWTDFGNTLRVFGTEEAVLKIAEWGF
jgi:poly(A)-specific ribonuclease